MAEAEDPDQDRIEKFELTQAGDTFTLMLKSKSEEFEFLFDRNTMQELADEIYYFLDKDEPKKAEFGGIEIQFESKRLADRVEKIRALSTVSRLRRIQSARNSISTQRSEIPMSISMYRASIPVFIRALGNLSAILKKGEAHEGIASFIDARLAPDMLTLAGQVQRASDAAKAGAARLGGIDNPSFPDTEKTFAELQARIKKTVDFLQSMKPEQIDGSERKRIEFKAGQRELKFTGVNYLLGFALPNFYFHVTTAYAILRHKGVQIGKMDYLGSY